MVLGLFRQTFKMEGKSIFRTANQSFRNTFWIKQSRPCPRRWLSNETRQLQRQFWTTGRVLLFTTFTGSLAYLFGIGDSSSFFKRNLAAGTKPSKPVYANKRELESAIFELRSKLGEDAVSTDDEDLHNHGYSEWSSINIDTLPVAVAYPKSTADVSEIAQVCHKYTIPIIPYCGGSSLEGNFSAPFGGVSVDFCFMDKLLALRPDDMDLTVQPAVGWMSLNEQIKGCGLFFPVDPGPSAMM